MFENRFTRAVGIRLPIIQAPLGGGPSTPALAAAVSNAGGLGSLAGGYLRPEQIREEIRQTRALTSAPFAVNVFALGEVPLPPHDALDAANRVLARYREELGLPPTPPLPQTYAEELNAQLEVIIEERPPLFSFTFGIPPSDVLKECRARGILTMGTATHLDEGRALQDAGVDFVCAQGVEAGGHRGTFLGPMERGMIGTMALVPQLASALAIPVIASGGISDGRGIAASLALGAEAASLGTAFLLADEAGTSRPYREALRNAAGARTAITRAFSGREARGLVNRFMEELARYDALPYPYQNALTRDLRKEAARAGRSEFLALWAGEGVASARELPAARIVEQLARELEDVLLALRASAD